MTIEELYKNFCEDFKKVSNLSLNSSSSEWTKAILRYFFKLGEKEHYRVYTDPQHVKETEGFYLVDLCWSKEIGKEYRDYKGLELVLESEWLTSEEEIMNDFCKLIDVKSFLKTMVICIKEKDIDTKLRKMTETIKSARIKFKEENYLVINFVPIPSISNPEKYIIEGYKINSEGVSQSLPPADFNLAS